MADEGATTSEDDVIAADINDLAKMDALLRLSEGSARTARLPLFMLAPGILVTSFLFGGANRTATVPIGIVFALVIGYIGYKRWRAYQQRWADPVEDISIYVARSGVEFGQPLEIGIEIPEGIEVDARMKQWGIVGWSIDERDGLRRTIGSGWHATRTHEQWRPLEHGRGLRTYKVMLPNHELAFDPKPTVVESRSAVRNHTYFVAAVRSGRGEIEMARTQAYIPDLCFRRRGKPLSFPAALVVEEL